MELKMIKLELTLEEVNVILGSLGKMPYEVVASVITKVQDQGAPQAQALAEAAKAEAAKAEAVSE
jgi:hypothetical protein